MTEFKRIESDLLDRIDAASVFELHKMDDGKFIIGERCDGYFDITLSAEELAALGQELINLAKVDN